jgi:hypothetical protein
LVSIATDEIVEDSVTYALFEKSEDLAMRLVLKAPKV